MITLRYQAPTSALHRDQGRRCGPAGQDRVEDFADSDGRVRQECRGDAVAVFRAALQVDADPQARVRRRPVVAFHLRPALLVAVTKCDPTKKGLKLADNNRRLTVNRSGATDKTGVGADALACVFETLQVPGALSDRMLSTTAADGQLRGDWPGYSVTWTNDYPKGLDLTVTRN